MRQEVAKFKSMLRDFESDCANLIESVDLQTAVDILATADNYGVLDLFNRILTDKLPSDKVLVIPKNIGKKYKIVKSHTINAVSYSKITSSLCIRYCDVEEIVLPAYFVISDEFEIRGFDSVEAAQLYLEVKD